MNSRIRCDTSRQLLSVGLTSLNYSSLKTIRSVKTLVG